LAGVKCTFPSCASAEGVTVAEFAAHIADALDTAEHIRARVAAKKFNGRKITLSSGVASFPEDADDAETIIAVADEALYQAKREGRDRTVRARRLKKTG